MDRHITFVLYDQASPGAWKENRGKVASHIGKHYRNRSAPLRNSVAKDAKRQKSTSGASGRLLLPIMAHSAVLDSSHVPNHMSGETDNVDKSPSLHELKQKLHGSEVVDRQRILYGIYPSLQQWVQFSYPQSHQRSADLGFDLGKHRISG
jgi:hypothetical protein